MKISNYLILILFCLVSFQAIGQDTLEQAPTIEETINQTIQSVTGNENAEIKMPSTFDPADANSMWEWWMFIYGILMPIGLYIFHNFFPSVKRSELIIKSTSVAIVVLIMIVVYNGRGATPASIGQAVLAFAMQFLAYVTGFKPFMKSSRKQNYDKSK